MMLFELVHECSPMVHFDTISSIIQTESSVNPFAIAEILPNKKVVSHHPHSRQDAINIINSIEKKNHNYSVGIAQINKGNFKRFDVNGVDLLDPCTNVRIAQYILQECYTKYHSVNDALSCYYSGNDRVGYRIEKSGDSYVQRVHKNFIKKVSNKNIYSIEIPSIRTEKNIDKKNKIQNNFSRKKSNLKQRKIYKNPLHLKYSSKINVSD